MSLEQTVDNLEIRYANAVTFVGTSNTMIDTTTGRIQTKGIQHNSNVITDVSGPHGRVAPTLKKYPEIVFDDTSKMDMGEGGTVGGLIFKQAGYTITASSTHPTNGRVPYRAFNGDHTTGWICASSSWNSGTNVYQGGRGIGGYDGEWIKLELPHKIKVETMYIEADLNSGRRPLTGKLLGSDDDSSWVIIKDLTSIPNQNKNTLNIGSTVAYKYIAFLTETIPNGNDTVWIDEIEYYGYEEDPPAGDHSVDTTFMSRFNNPQTTGVQVLVDGATGVGTNQISGGPDPSGNQSTYVTDGKYWTLDGTLTSNLAVEANTFLEGDQPHAVSVWFNSSNLEANTANTCVFSISDQEKLDSVNLDLQSNTWHNLTYAYQGEGGSRVTYLDGRKVAEDQAEDTFGEYPPFAMTGYSQGGYVVSASSEHNDTRIAWKAFNDAPVVTGSDVTGTFWQSLADTYETTGGNYNWTGTSVQFTDTNGGQHSGEWIKMEMPHKLKLDYLYYLCTYDAFMAKNFVILGSNDDTTWTLLKSVTNGPSTEDVYHDLVINADRSYKYYVVLTSAIHGTGGEVLFANISFYGHRENDLVRLPDPTNVLKYPHIAMTGYAQRGYVVTTNNGTDVYNVFAEGGSSTVWTTASDTFSTSGTYGAIGGDTITDIESTQHTGHWMKLQLPRKITLSRFVTTQFLHPQYQLKTYVLLGSNDNSTWVLIHNEPDADMPGGSSNGTEDVVSFSEGTPSAYKYYMLLVKNLEGAGGILKVGNTKLFGTEENSSIPIQIGGGNIDKVANFRVYDKFVGEDQALEIWDAQKDAFGRAKSSMTLQKGRLGIGTTEPEGRLAVLDEPNTFEPRWPPKPLVGYKTHIEGYGEFCVHMSPDEDTGLYRGNSWYIFDDNQNTWNYTYHGERDTGTGKSYFGGANGEYTGGKSIGGISGDWTVLESPNPIKINDIIRMRVRSAGQYTKGFIIAAANKFDGVWTKLTEQSNLVWQTGGVGESKTFHFENDTYYKYYAIIITQAPAQDGYPTLSNMEFSGIVQQGQSVLHDGQLTLTKNLNVPRIGPALDADDTPRRDRLVVEYNTSTNPTFEGAVRDTSGRGLDAILRDATYDATDKSIRVGTSQDIFLAQGIPGKSGDVTNVSYSIWFNADNVTDANQIIMSQISAYAVGVGLTLALNTNELQLGFGYAYSSGQQIGGAVLNAISAGQWYHVVAIKKGSGTLNATTLPDILEIYINGEKKTLSHGGGTGTLNVGTDHWLIIGSIQDTHSTAEEFKGNVSSIKYYDTALTAEEIKTLYDMGRNGSVANPQPLHIAAPLYSPGTIVQVEQSIKTDTFSTNGAGNHPLSPGNDVPGLAVTIHPKFANSKILVSYTVSTGAYGRAYLRIQRKQGGVTTNIEAPVGPEANTDGRGKATTSHNGGGEPDSQSFEYYDAVGGTEPITYQIQAWTYHSTYYVYVNRGHADGNGSDNGTYWARTLSSITAREVCQ